MRGYTEALSYLNQFINYERAQPQRYAPETWSLERVNRLLDRLGRPDRAYRAIHIAGTKGKGSTAAMIEACLRAAGYRTGLYISPHLHTFRERMQVNRNYISREQFAQFVDELEPHLNAVEGLTWFEIVTALAFMFFAREKVDVAVLEVGLGGRFDATNVVTPLVSVITPLSMDHMNLLGNSIEQIAFEKAGIIKKHVPVVSAPQQPEALDVIGRVARIRGAALIVPRSPTPFAPAHLSTPETKQGISGEGELEGARLSLLGAHQVTNASVAAATLHVANEHGLRVSEEAIRQGLADVKWPGRLEVLSRDPLLVVDGAHNGDSAQKLASALREVFEVQKWTLIVGISGDKDIPAIFEALLPVAERVIVTRARNVRAADVEVLAEQVVKYGQQPLIASSTSAALDIAQEYRAPIIVTGSLFTVADAREAWLMQHGVMVDKD